MPYLFHLISVLAVVVHWMAAIFGHNENLVFMTGSSVWDLGVAPAV